MNDEDHDGAPGDREPVDPRALLDTVRAVFGELHPARARDLELTLDSTLDRDLGLDSLSRVELMVRIERRFGRALGESAMAAAETPRDLLRALQSADAGTPTTPGATMGPGWEEEEDGAAVPDGCETLAEVLDWHAAAHGDRVHVQMHGDDTPGEALSYGALASGARQVAAGLRAAGLEPGQSAAIMLPTGGDYFRCFLGVILAGGIPVPIYPPARPSQLEDHVRRHAQILANAGVRLLVSFDQARPVARLLEAQVESLRGITTVSDLRTHGILEDAAPMSGESIAFLQYTSGSTGNPKGVTLTHANLLANLRAMGKGIMADPGDVFVSWLPLYHDMGLIGAWMGSLYFGFPLVLMSPLAFLGRPARWLRAISQHRGTLSAGPNFAYELCLRRIDDEELEGVDLSSWRLAFNGAEPVSAETLEKFATRFAPFGLRREAIAPVYGLAEATLGVCFPPLGRGAQVDVVDREALTRRSRAVPATPEAEDPLRIVACGQPLPGYQVRIVDETGHEVPERSEGRLEFQGPSTTRGYYRNTEATRALFHDGWLVTGDLAYVAGGDVYLTGRTKDVIIRAGRNIYPYELEEAVGGVEGIRRGCVAVFGATDPTSRTERLVVVAETREQDETVRAALRDRIVTLAIELLGMPPDEVVLAPPQSVLKTSSGKIRRAGTRELFERGQIRRRHRGVWLQVARLALSGVGPWLRARRRALGERAYAAWAWVLVLVLGTLTWLGLAVLPGIRSRWWLTRHAARLLFAAAGSPVRTTGVENVPAGGPFVLVANHASFLDGAVVMTSLKRPVRFVAKRELTEHLVPRRFLTGIGARFVERFDTQRGVDDARRATRDLQAGDALGFFPEGTFKRMPGLLPFHMGAFVAAAEAGVPVLPVVVRGTRSVLRAGPLFPRRGALAVHIGPPITPGEVAGSEATDWERAVALRDGARGYILEHCGEPDLAAQETFL